MLDAFFIKGFENGSLSPIEQENFLQQQIVRLQRKMHTKELESTCINIDIISDLQDCIKLCDKATFSPDTANDIKKELTELFEKASKINNDKQVCIHDMIRKFQADMNPILVNYDYSGEFDKICSLIREFPYKTQQMTNFLHIDISALRNKQNNIILAETNENGTISANQISNRINKNDTVLVDQICYEINRFNNKLQNISDTHVDFSYWRKEFKKICRLISKLHTPVAEFERFRLRIIDKVIYEVQNQKKLQKDISEKISTFKRNMQKFPGSYNYQKEFDNIRRLIKQADNKTEQMTDVENMNTNEISMRQEIVESINARNQLDLEEIKTEYAVIYKKLHIYGLHSVFAEYLDTLYIQKTQNWFEKHVTDRGQVYKIDEEQAAAIVDNHKNLLVKALAGSGKTRTLVAKIVYLVAICKVPESEIMAFVFNKDAAKEINDRLKEIKIDGKQIITESLASTFHSFAYGNTKHSKILSDQDGKNRSLFIQDIISDIIPRENIYNFFRKEATKIGREQFKSDEDFYKALRARQFVTLDNRKVKSIGEKIICDFLFEHGINYMYEPNVYTSNLVSIAKSESIDFIQQKDCIKPDFLLTDYNMVWEHWAITGNESPDIIKQIDKKGVIGKYSDYKDTMEWKRDFYKREWIDHTKEPDNKYAQQVIDWKRFLETNYDESLSREDFEQTIETLLKTYGITPQKLPKEELVRKVWEKQVKRFTSLVVQFIDRTEQEYIQDISDLKEKIKKVPEYSRERRFLDIALQVYITYREKLANDPIYDMDFNVLMDKISKEILSDSDVRGSILNKKYILIDEFQDFSKLFLNFINATRQINPSLHLMCVGDDYQAINRFAGSNVEYFINFSKYFTEDPCILNINTNYRCASSIVANAKDFMTKTMCEHTNFTASKKEVGTVNILNINQVFIENRSGHVKRDNIFKKKMTIQENGTPYEAVKYLKSVVCIINKHKDKKSIKILHRNNDMSFWNIDLNLFYRKIKETCAIMKIMPEEEFKQKVSIGTMHSAKGLEAEVVILLEIDNSIIPSIHPDSSLFEIFGETEEVVIEDQKRLFYVALTRAEDDLYILYNGEKKSDFLNDLPIAKELKQKDIRFSK